MKASPENLPGQLFLPFRRERFVKRLHPRIIHVTALRRLVYTGGIIQISRDQFFAEKKGGIRVLRQIMIADPELTGIVEAALSVESDVPLKQNCTVTESCRFLQRMIQQGLAVTLSLQFRCDPDVSPSYPLISFINFLSFICSFVMCFPSWNSA